MVVNEDFRHVSSPFRRRLVGPRIINWNGMRAEAAPQTIPRPVPL
ncbi:hypothetical protein SAMCFNEI73_Ch0527 [Sinorhizobium americanum]|uniref:Uncharacterized protein n=1 Tax=Sinorhizobium americanum TaxID=194963 RepID=A0A1L3LIH3_9HYPH|nr:hypothetical protein SAMCCGM7_Ch0529 [Sinorhizobium americanum CCGM7]APG89856.1 hypothetical protein SAMCFNEI73_Ch0527 [Sinorhizobium americanum]